MTSTLLQRWIDLSVALTNDETSAIPLIDFLPPLSDLDENLHQIWRHGDHELHEGFVQALLENPGSLGIRFAALNAYYKLMDHKPEDETLSDLTRQQFLEKLKILVGFQPVEHSTDLRTIRWEIVNSCAVGDYARAFGLCDRLQSFLPSWEFSFTRGKLRFLTVHLPSWKHAQFLKSWDLPIGPPRPKNQIMDQIMGSPLLSHYHREPLRAEEISVDAKAEIRKAIAYLETALDENPDISPECLYMLAMSYSAVGHNHDAAKCLPRVITQRDALGELSVREFSVVSIEDILSALFHQLALAHLRAEELDKAIGAVSEWMREFPDDQRAYPLMARIHEEKGDIRAAAGWYRKGADKFPGFGEDLKTSLILKLGETSSPASIDQIINAYIDNNSPGIRLISFALERHWPSFKCLDKESRESWSAGIHLLSVRPYGETSLYMAVSSFTGVLERTLRQFIFIPFREECLRNTELSGDFSDPADDSIFCKFLSGKLIPTLGQMLTITDLSRNSQASPFPLFAEWLQGKRPSYFNRIGQLREKMMLDLRNRAAHFNKKAITETDAEKLLEAIKEMIPLVSEDLMQ